MTRRIHIENILEILNANGISLSAFLHDVLDHEKPSQNRNPLLGNVADICTGLQRVEPERVFAWAFEEVRKRVAAEVVLMSEARRYKVYDQILLILFFVVGL
jgi:hypothetical protein